MSTLGTYSFLPWLRLGLANEIQNPDGDATARVRAKIDVKLELRGDRIGGGPAATEAIDRPVQLFGPADVVGLDPRAIVRMEPRPGVSNFEPNYLPAIELYAEDLPWRYTPAKPDATRGRLRPWMTLIVLVPEVEFKDGPAGGPLPCIDLKDLSPLPKADELWAWAHVHVNRDLSGTAGEFVSRDMDAVIPRLEGVLRENPDLAYARIVCPRKLAPNTPYHAFLVPTFEGGRRAGLDIPIGDIPATMSAWDPGARPDPLRFPYYHRWSFHTGTNGDFETLVRLLRPRRVDPRVGKREMDVQHPGSGVRGVDRADLGGILMLGGALKPPKKDPPDPPTVFDTWDEPFPRPLQEDLAELVNLPARYAEAGDPDPIVAPPVYGTWHAMSKVVDLAGGGDRWLERLNLDPRYRTAAGFGTRIVQDQQETLMDAAWDQLGQVLEAQRRIRLGQLAVQVSEVWWDRHLMPALAVDRQQALRLIAPLNKRVLVEGGTVHHVMAQSLVAPALTSAPLRRLVRPRSRLLTGLPFDGDRRPQDLVDRVNAGEVSAAPPKPPPPGLATDEVVADAVVPSRAPGLVVDALRRNPRLPLLVLLIAIVLAILLLPLAPIILLIGIWLWRLLRRWAAAIAASGAVGPGGQTVAAAEALPTRGPEDERYKAAVVEAFGVAEAADKTGTVPERRPLDLAGLAGGALAALEPAKTIPKRVRRTVDIPPRIVAEIGDRFVEPMAHPVIDVPMYEPLKDRSDELFLPNIDLIEPNTITLLETNQPFIEAYMAGLNHELARELLWREYPTDQRGSPLRQFWDPRGYFTTETMSDDALRERVRDIKPLHKWGRSTALGAHDNRDPDGVAEDELVLTIRGELLKRYPTAVVYAHRAEWQKTDGEIDPTKERRLVTLTAAQEAKPPRQLVRTPIYEAKVDPDITFLGFDITASVARGGTGADPDDDPGWFFVIKERPGEPRFGLDNEQQDDLNVWNDLAWPDVQPGPAGTFIDLATAPASFPLVAPVGDEQEKQAQNADDVKVSWSRDMSSAELAYILFQAPVLVGVHASEMLP